MTPIYFRPILMLTSNLCLGFTRVSSCRFNCENFETSLPSSILATCSADLNLPDLITVTILEFKFKRKIRTWTGIWTSDLEISNYRFVFTRWTIQTMKFLTAKPSSLPFLLDPNICLKIHFSNTFSLLFSLDIKDDCNMNLIYRSQEIRLWSPVG